MKPDDAARPKSAADGDWNEQPLEWPRAIGRVDLLLDALAVRQKRQRRRRAVAIGIAGGVAALAMVAAGTLGLPWFSDAPAADTVAAAASRVSEPNARKPVVVAPERRVLPDGSKAELNAGAELVVNFDAHSTGVRHVTLLRGEAHFDVAKNPARPFVVEAGGVQFRAVGTAFAVGLQPGGAVEMVVTEGRVAVEPQGTSTPSSAAAPTLVSAGHRVVVGAGEPISPQAQVTPISNAEANERLAWRIPRLEFNETPLANVVDSLNQFGGRRVILANESLGRIAVSGAMRADNLEPLLQMLETNYHIGITRDEGSRIVLRAAR